MQTLRTSELQIINYLLKIICLSEISRLDLNLRPAQFYPHLAPRKTAVFQASNAEIANSDSPDHVDFDWAQRKKTLTHIAQHQSLRHRCQA